MRPAPASRSMLGANSGSKIEDYCCLEWTKDSSTQNYGIERGHHRRPWLRLIASFLMSTQSLSSTSSSSGGFPRGLGDQGDCWLMNTPDWRSQNTAPTFVQSS